MQIVVGSGQLYTLCILKAIIRKSNELRRVFAPMLDEQSDMQSGRVLQGRTNPYTSLGVCTARSVGESALLQETGL